MTESPDDETVAVTLDRTVVWKVGFAADTHTREGVDLGRYPFRYRLDVLVRGCETFHEREGRPWRAAAPDRPAPDGLVAPATVNSETTVSLGTDLVDRLTAAVTDEYPDRDPGAQPPRDRVALLVSAWNDYYAPRGLGWRPPTE